MSEVMALVSWSGAFCHYFEAGRLWRYEGFRDSWNEWLQIVDMSCNCRFVLSTEISSPIPLDSDMKKQEHLWQNHSPNFLAEKAFNAAVAALQPHCAVCSLFCPYARVGAAHLAALYVLLVPPCWGFFSCRSPWPPKPQTDPSVANETANAPFPRHGSWTRPLVPEMCFSVGAGNTEPPPTNHHIREDGTSLLIRCPSCEMQVHASK